MAMKIYVKPLFFALMLFCGTSYSAENKSLVEACVKGCASASYDKSDKGKGLQTCINACMNIAEGENQDNSSKSNNDNYKKLMQKDDLPVYETGIGNRFSITFNYSEYDYKGGFNPASHDYLMDDSHVNSPAVYAGYDLMEYAQLGIGYRKMTTLDLYGYNAQHKKIYLLEFSSYMIEMYLKIYLLNLPIQSEGSSFQVYAKASRNRVYEKYKYASGIIVKDEAYTTGFGTGIDFSLGRQSNYIIGGEIRYYVKGNKAFANFAGVNAGWRFGTNPKK